MPWLCSIESQLSEWLKCCKIWKLSTRYERLQSCEIAIRERDYFGLVFFEMPFLRLGHSVLLRISQLNVPRNLHSAFPTLTSSPRPWLLLNAVCYLNRAGEEVTIELAAIGHHHSGVGGADEG